MNLKAIENREQSSRWRNSDNLMLLRIQEYLKNGNYKSIRRIYKSFCEKNIYFLKSRHLGLFQSQFLQEIIQLSFKVYSALNLHTNFQLNEFLPLLLYIFKKYQLTLGVHLNFAKLTSAHPPLTATNNGRQLLGLSSSRLSEQINNIDLLMKKKSDLFQQIESSNCEIEILIKPTLIASNQAFLRLKRRKKIDQQFLRKLFNGISNEGGGIVIFGIKKSISAENKKNDQLDYKFKKSIEFILSSFSYIKKLQITQIQPPKQSLFAHQQCDRDFYEVIIHPLQQNRLNFVDFPSQKDKEKSFKFYKLDCLGQPFEVNEHCENIYRILHSLYRDSFRKKAPQTTSNDETKTTKESKHNKFKFLQSTKNKALMLVKKNGEKDLINYLRLLKNNKYEVEVSKFNCQSIELPQNQGVKILTHQCSYAQLKLMLKICEQQGSVEENTLKLMLPSKILKMNSNKFSQKESKELKLKIRKQMQMQMQMQNQGMEIVEIERVRHKGREILLLKFDGIDGSVVGLMCLLEMGMSPTFVKQALSSCNEYV